MPLRMRWLPLLCALSLTACGPSESERRDQAQTIAHDALIADLHIDAPFGLHEDGWRDLSQRVDDREFDFPKSREGGLDLAFMSIYIPSSYEANAGTAKALADKLIDYVEAMAGRAPDKFAVVRDAGEAEAAKAAGKVALALGMENGAPIEGELDNLRHFHARGIRYITLAHSLSNHIADASFDSKRPWGGLSPFGYELVAEMNRLGVMVDVSHLSDDTIRDVLKVSRAPVIATHSSARHFTPGFERNLSDELAKAVAEKGGVIHVNFGSSFLTPEANDWFTKMRAARAAWQAESGETGEAASEAWLAAYRQGHPFPYATLSQLADHIDHFVKLVGVDHIGLGSDFDGVGDTLPEGIKTVADYPALVAELLRRDYREEDIRKILGGNTLRVWREVDKVAAGK